MVNFFSLFKGKRKAVRPKKKANRLKRKRPGKPKKTRSRRPHVKRKAPRVKRPLIKKEIPIGKIVHYFPKVHAGVIKITKGAISLGDQLRFKGHTTDFKQTTTSIQINHLPIKKAKKGDEIGILVNSRVRRGDSVYKL